MNSPGEPTGTRFEQILVPVERGLRLALDEARAATSHPGDIGASVEAATRIVFKQRMPSGFDVGEGKVYDAYGDESAQVDVVITTPDHPFSYPPQEANGAFFIEGVLAAGEVKSRLTTDALDDCITKGSRFKRLRPTYYRTDRILTDRAEQMLTATGAVPPFFVIAFENYVKISTLLERLNAAPLVPTPEGKLGFRGDDRGRSPQPPIDVVCLLEQGVLLNLREGSAIELRGNTPDSVLRGWVAIDTAAPLALTLAFLHATPRIYRSMSGLVPYLIPGGPQADYMAAQFGWSRSSVKFLTD